VRRNTKKSAFDKKTLAGQERFFSHSCVWYQEIMDWVLPYGKLELELSTQILVSV